MKTTPLHRSSSACVTDGIIIVSLLVLFLPLAVSESGEYPPPAPYFSQRVNPSMAVVIGVLFVSFFFVAFFSIYVRQCVRNGSAGSARRSNTAAARSRLVQRGIDPSVIESFPTFLYSEVKELKVGKGTLECAVCLSEFEEDETLRMLPKCSHVFHPDCIDTWLTSHTTCPVCRYNLGAATASETAADVPDHAPEDHVAITVDDGEQSEDLNRVLNPMQDERTRSRFLRSHTTGHSLVQPGENLERFTLRLPEHVKKNLNCTISCVSFPANGGSVSSRRGNKGGGEGSSRGRSFRFVRFDRRALSDRWILSRTRPLSPRTFSGRAQRRGDGEGTGTGKVFFRSLTMPLNCFGAKADSAEKPSASGSARGLFYL